MKKKIIIITILAIFFSILIYFYTKKDEINIVALGDSLALGMTPYNIEGYSFNDYLKEDYKNKHKLNKYIYEFSNQKTIIKELIYEIKENKSLMIKNEKIEIQRAINEADILTIAIGMDELANDHITTKIKKEFKEDLEELLSMIKMLNKNKVVIIGHYKTKYHDNLEIAKINAIIRDISLTNNFKFIEINNILNNNNYYLDKNNYYLNYLGHKKIYEEIKKHL